MLVLDRLEKETKQVNILTATETTQNQPRRKGIVRCPVDDAPGSCVQQAVAYSLAKQLAALSTQGYGDHLSVLMASGEGGSWGPTTSKNEAGIIYFIEFEPDVC